MRLICILVCVALALAALWGGFYSLHLIHAPDFAERGGSWDFHWADIPVVISMIAAIAFCVVVGSVFTEDL